MDGVRPSAFEAAPLRYVHDVLTGEFVSLGVVVLCPERQYLGFKFLSSHRRVKVIFPDADPIQTKRLCSAISDSLSCERSRLFSELQFDETRSLASVLSRIVPPNDAALQFPSTLVSGITTDPARTLLELFDRYAFRHRETPAKVTRGDDEVWNLVAARLRELDLLRQLREHVLKGPHRYELPLRHAWRNGIWNAVQPVSLDLAEPREIRERALSWTARIDAVKPAKNDVRLRLFVGEPGTDRPKAVREAARDAVDMLLEGASGEAELVREAQAASIVTAIARDLKAHQ